MRPENLLRSVLTFGLGLAVFNMASTAMAAPLIPTPEIATASAAGAIALLVGGGLMLAERMRIGRR